MKRRIYIDVSVLAGCMDDRYREDSRRLINRFIRGEDIMVISELTLRELEKAAPAVHDLANQVPSENIELLKLSDEAHELAAVYASSEGKNQIVKNEVNELRSDSPIANLVDSLLRMGIDHNVREIVIEPFPTSIGIKIRIDGAICNVPAPPRDQFFSILYRLKAMAELATSEKPETQIGIIKINHQHRDYKLDLSITPSDQGETVTIRIPEKSVGPGMPIERIPPEDLHVALATAARVNFIVSLNGRHTAPDRNHVYYLVNSDKSYPLLKIRTPAELAHGD